MSLVRFAYAEVYRGNASEYKPLELFYYYPTKLVNDWVDDKLEVTGFGSSSTADTV